MSGISLYILAKNYTNDKINDKICAKINDKITSLSERILLYEKTGV